MNQTKIQLPDALKLVDAFRKALPPNTGAVHAEYAALLFYCNVAEGVGKYPAHLRMERAVLVADRGAKALVKAIGEVGQFSEAQIRAELLALSK